MSSNLSSKLFLYSLLFIALTIPFQWKYLPFSVGITMLGLVWFFGGNLTQKIKKFAKNPYAILLSGLYIIYLISILYSENKEYAYTDLLLKTIKELKKAYKITPACRSNMDSVMKLTKTINIKANNK